MDFSWILIFCITFGLWKIGNQIYQYYLLTVKINKIPGPSFGFPIIGAIKTITSIKREDEMQWLHKIASEYNGIFKIWIGFDPHVYINKPQYIGMVLRNSKQISKSLLYNYLEPWLGRGLLTSDGEKWFHDRKMINPTFNFSIIENFAEVMIEKSVILNKRIYEKVKIYGDQPFDVFAMIASCTLDIICETAMGVNIYAEDEVGSEYIRAVRCVLEAAVDRVVRPWLKFDWIYYKTEDGKRYKAAIETTHENCTRIIERKQAERREEIAIANDNIDANDDVGTPKRRAFLDLLLESSEKNSRRLTIEEIREQVNTFMVAGHDTSGTLVSWSLFCIGNDEKIQNRIHQELDEVFGDSDEPATTKQIHQLKYLDRVIKETLRFYPSVAMIGRKITEDLQMGQYTIPKGASLTIQIYQLHRDPEFWPNPTKFDPDRFLPENSENRQPYAYIPFSGGLRNCIGEKYALLEAKIVLTEVLRKWIVKSRDNHDNIKRYNSITLTPDKGIFLNMYQRNSKK